MVCSGKKSDSSSGWRTRSCSHLQGTKQPALVKAMLFGANKMCRPGIASTRKVKGRRKALRTLLCFPPQSPSGLSLPSLAGMNCLCLLEFTLHHIRGPAHSFSKSKPSHYCWVALPSTTHTHTHAHSPATSLPLSRPCGSSDPSTKPLPKQKPHSTLCCSPVCIFPAALHTVVSAASVPPTSSKGCWRNDSPMTEDLLTLLH